LWLVNTQLTQL